MMPELTIQSFLRDGGKMKKVKASDKTMKDINRFIDKLITSKVDTELGKSVIKSIKETANKENKNER